jgi:ribosome-binding factor A
MGRRIERVKGLLQAELSQLLLQDLNDPRLNAMVTITNVTLSPDLQHATVGVTVLGSRETEHGVLEALTSASGFLRRETAGRLRLKRAPDLRFEIDETIRDGDGVLSILDAIRDMDEDRHA